MPPNVPVGGFWNSLATENGVEHETETLNRKCWETVP